MKSAKSSQFRVPLRGWINRPGSLLQTLEMLSMGLQRMTGVLLNNRNQRKVESTMLKTKSDWDINMERILIKEKGDKKEKEVRIAGRCKSCWGGLIARRNEAYEWIEIKCRICGTTVEGQDAQKEKEKMLEEGISNLMMMNMGLGNNPKYGDGFFVGKLFPSIERQTNKEQARQTDTE